MKTIIVPTDFSDTSLNAAFYAVEMALYLHADIKLLHVLALPLTISEVPLPQDSYEILQTEAKESLNKLKERLESYSKNKLSITCRVSMNAFLDEIEGFSKKKDVFAVIMGTSGAGATRPLFLGSFSLSAAKHLNYPLIVVPPEYKYKIVERIGLAYDMNSVHEDIPIMSLQTMFSRFGAQLEILYVTKSSEKMSPEVLIESKFLQNNLAHYHPNIRIITSKDIKQGLEDFIRKSGIDLLLLLPKERNFIESIFHKSVTKKMVLHPTVPVMILRN